MSRDISQQNATVPSLPSAAQDLALTSLLGGATVTAAAKTAGVNRATVHRWLDADPVFIAAYNSFRVEMADSVRQELRLLAADAVRVMRSVLSDKQTPPAVKLKAAGEVLKLAFADRIDGPTDPEIAATAIRRRDMTRFAGGHRRLV